MSRRKRQEPGGPAASRPARARVVAALAAVGLAIVLAWAPWRPAPASVPAASAARPPAPAPPEFAALVGNWLRLDGGYELSVSGVAADGTASVAYFNPKPIRVARAEARREGERVRLFVKFDDVNYPGSTYTLAYDPANDSLQGDYFQAVQGAHYDVAFVRRR